MFVKTEAAAPAGPKEFIPAMFIFPSNTSSAPSRLQTLSGHFFQVNLTP
jgi:hypothetical protein